MIGRYFKLKIFFHSSFIWYIFVLSAHLHGISSNKSSENFYELGQAQGCPLENYHGTQIIGQVNKQLSADPSQNSQRGQEYNYGVGDKISYDCNFDLIKRANKLGSELIVYPSKNRTCKSSGTWSSVPPICVGKFASSSLLDAIPLRTKLCCSEQDCSHVHSSNWATVGRQPNCSRNANKSDKMQTFDILFTFHRHFHLSFMTFELPSEANGFYVEIRVPRENIIEESEFSEESLELLENHYRHPSTENVCAIIGIAAYTQQILVRFSVQTDKAEDTICNGYQDHCWKPRPKFYPFSEFAGNVNRHGSGCPEPPSIPKSDKSNVTRPGEKQVFQYHCPPGMLLINPITNMPSKKEIHCHKGYEWVPYPFPVCRPISPMKQRDNASNILEENEPNSYIPASLVEAKETNINMDQLPEANTKLPLAAIPRPKKMHKRRKTETADAARQLSGKIPPTTVSITPAYDSNRNHTNQMPASFSSIAYSTDKMNSFSQAQYSENHTTDWSSIILIMILSIFGFFAGLVMTAFFYPRILQRLEKRNQADVPNPEIGV